MAEDLNALKGVLLKVCGDLTTSVAEVDGQVAIAVRHSHSEQFKKAVKDYVVAYNRSKGSGITVSMANPFAIKLREAKRSARAAR